MTKRPNLPPEGQLVMAALAQAGFSQREAARRIDLSEARWRQIVYGYQTVGRRKAPVRGPDETVARIAHGVGVSPEDLEAAGRAGAAAELRALREAARAAEEAERAKAAEPRPPEPEAPARVDERWPLVEAVLRQASAGLSPDEQGTLASRVKVFFEQPPRGRASGNSASAPASPSASSPRPSSPSPATDPKPATDPSPVTDPKPEKPH